MIITAGIGAAAAAFLELRIVGALPSLRDLAMRSKLFGLLLSLIISQSLALMTGTTGVLSMMIFIMSTVITQAAYSVWAIKSKMNAKREAKRLAKAA